ncbi:MAG: hypothetical protein A2542_02095 [Parcubacteria group bacterium RIFOXYD2_FULL_52_8]|nr:MAG: hypothetical protein A2542_02095 [Parcubacteria group bacterium RIFOXYD2_FULL_52_8]
MVLVSAWILLIAILLLACLLVVFAGAFLYRVRLGWSRAHAPFVPVGRWVLPQIVRTLALKKSSVLYDLGSGDGRVLFGAYDSVPEASYRGVDHELLPYYVARARARYLGIPHERVRFMQRNFFEVPLADATHVFVYLHVNLMDLLLPKLERELRPGTRLVSCDFPFSAKRPTEVIDLQSGNRLNQRLYVYEF